MEKSFYERCQGIYKLHSCVEENLENLMVFWGSLVAKRAYLMIVISLSLGVALSFGIYFAEVDDDPEKMWVPENSSPAQNKGTVESYFGELESRYLIYITSKTSNKNLIDVGVYSELEDFDEQFKALRSGDVQFESICWRQNSANSCNFYEFPLNFWQQADGTINFDSITPFGIQTKIGSGKGDPALYPSYDHIYIPVSTMFSGRRPLNLTVTETGENNVYYFEAIQYEYFTQPTGISDSELENWESEVETLIDSFNTNSTAITVNLYYLGRIEKDLIDALSYDLILYGAALAFIFLYAIFIIGRCSPVHCRFPLSLAMIVSFGLSMLMSFGFLGYIGVTLISANGALTFLLALETIMYSSYLIRSLENLEVPMEEAVNYPMFFVLGFKKTGVSLLKNMIVVVTVFLIGSLSQFPGISSFCATGACASLFLFFNTLTLFTGSLYYDFVRVAQQRSDCCGQCYCDAESNFFCKGICVYNEYSETRTPYFEQWIQSKFLPFVNRSSVTVIILVLFTCFIIVGVTSCFYIKQEFEVDWLIDDESNGVDQVRDNYFGSRGYVLGIYMIDTNFASQEAQKNLKSLYTSLKDCEGCSEDWVESDTVFSFYDSLVNWVELGGCYGDDVAELATLTEDGTIPSELFQTCLDQWQETQHAGFFANDLVIENGLLKAARLTCRLKYIRAESEAVQAKNDIESITDKYASGSTFPFNVNFLYYAQFEALFREMMLFGLILLICAGGYHVFLTVFPSAILFMILNMISVFVSTLASMWILSVEFNVVSLPHLYMIMIFSFEFTANIIHAYINSEGTKDERYIQTFKFIGGSLPHIGIAVIIASIAFLTPTTTYIFDVWGKVWGSASVFLFFNCFVVLPLLLRLFGPEDYKIEEELQEIDNSQSIVKDDFTIDPLTFDSPYKRRKNTTLTIND